MKRIASLLFVLLLAMVRAHSSQAYGTIGNFDVVNDTGHVCHGFEIELEDCHSTDITYTYDWNHYGKCSITEDDSIALHPKTRIRWASAKKPDGSWSAQTNIPTAPIAPTNGHQFTNPAVNFGGEHFGVGYRSAPSSARYYWLKDDGTGTLVRGAEVQVAMPVFRYNPPVGNVAANVVAVIAPVPEPAPVKEFGEPVWVKEIRTTTHNNEEIKLRDLQSDDLNNPPVKDWRNNEPDEVEVEWQLLQEDFNSVQGGANGELEGAPEDLENGDEVVTRRYEFYAYTGPFDNESYEAMADAVAADGEHGVGNKLINGADVNLANLVIVGDYLGAQMAAFDQDAALNLIEHVSDGSVNQAYAARQVVISGSGPFTCTRGGQLPPGMAFNTTTGVLSGTPTSSGSYQFSIEASDATTVEPVKKNYSIVIAAAGEALPPQFSVDTLSAPLAGGSTMGDGAYAAAANITVTAVAAAGYEFLSWMDNDVVVSTSASYTFTTLVNRSLVAQFIPIQREISISAAPLAGGSFTGDGFYDEGSSATVTATANAGYTFSHWAQGGIQVSSSASYTFSATADRALVAHFTVVGMSRSIATSSNPVAGGTTSGAGTFADGSPVTVTATANAGYTFSHWTEGGAQVSSSSSYAFVSMANRILVAQFTPVGGGGNMRSISGTVSPANSGSITGAGSYAQGASVELKANNAAGYKFTHWEENGVTVSLVKSYPFTATADRVLVAFFEPALSIAVSAQPPQGGLVEPDADSYEEGDGADVQADAEPGYTFLYWTEDGQIVSTDWKYEFTITESRSLVAHFQSQGNAVISVTASPTDAGTVSGSGTYAIGAPVTTWAHESTGYKFTHWSEGGLRVNTDEDYQFTASANRSLVAHFIAVPDTHMKDSSEDPDELEFEWPDNAAGWVLQESADMVTWVNSARPITQTGGKKKAKINKHSVPGVFFRLVKP